jgi:hypothetical protein
MQSESRREDLAHSASAQCPGAARAPTPSVRFTSPAQLRLRAQKENPAAGDGRGFRTIGRPGIGGGLGGRPSPLVARNPGQVQSVDAEFTGAGTTRASSGLMSAFARH